MKYYTHSSSSSTPVVPGAIEGGVFFGGSSSDVIQDATNLFWDNTNKRLGINTNTPASRLEIKDNGTAVAVVARITQDDANVSGLVIGNTTYSATLLKGLLLKVDNSGIGYIYSNGSDASPTNPLLLNPTGGSVGINAPSTAGAPLDIWAGTPTIMGGTDVGAVTRTANTNKQSIYTCVHYNTSSTPVHIISATSSSTDNVINVGGGSSYNAATTVGWYTAANSSTATGSLRVSLASSGNLTISTGKLNFDFTTSNASNNQTLNKPSGSFLVDSTISSVTLTNSFVTANSLVFYSVINADTDFWIKNVVVSAGQFVMNFGAVTTDLSRIGFLVVNT